MRITLDLTDEVHARLMTLTHGEFSCGDRVEDVIYSLIDHAQQGVYRPGAWERGWLMQAFGEDFLEVLETDPDTPCFERPKKGPTP